MKHSLCAKIHDKSIHSSSLSDFLIGKITFLFVKNCILNDFFLSNCSQLLSQLLFCFILNAVAVLAYRGKVVMEKKEHKYVFFFFFNWVLDSLQLTPSLLLFRCCVVLKPPPQCFGTWLQSNRKKGGGGGGSGGLLNLDHLWLKSCVVLYSVVIVILLAVCFNSISVCSVNNKRNLAKTPFWITCPWKNWPHMVRHTWFYSIRAPCLGCRGVISTVGLTMC